jgi:hypothetical protein
LAELRLRLTNAGGVLHAVVIIAIDRAITIVIDTVGASPRLIGHTTAVRRTYAVGVIAIHCRIAIIIDSVETVFASRRRRAAAVRITRASRIGTVRDTVAVIVRRIRTRLLQTGVYIGVQIIAVVATTQRIDESVLVVVFRSEGAASRFTTVCGA